MATIYRTLKSTRTTSLSSEVTLALSDTTYKVRLHALTQAVRLRLATGDGTHFYTIDAGDELEIELPELAGATLYAIEAAASAVLEMLEFLKTAA
jgi:GTPase